MEANADSSTFRFSSTALPITWALRTCASREGTNMCSVLRREKARERPMAMCSDG